MYIHTHMQYMYIDIIRMWLHNKTLIPTSIDIYLGPGLLAMPA